MLQEMIKAIPTRLRSFARAALNHALRQEARQVSRLLFGDRTAEIDALGTFEVGTDQICLS